METLGSWSSDGVGPRPRAEPQSAPRMPLPATDHDFASCLARMGLGLGSGGVASKSGMGGQVGPGWDCRAPAPYSHHPAHREQGHDSTLGPSPNSPHSQSMPQSLSLSFSPPPTPSLNCPHSYSMPQSTTSQPLSQLTPTPGLHARSSTEWHRHQHQLWTLQASSQ